MSDSASWDFFHFERTEAPDVNSDSISGGTVLIHSPVSGEMRSSHIDWGDGTPIEYYPGDGITTHVYAQPGHYTIKCKDAKRPELTCTEDVHIVKGLATLEVHDQQIGGYIELTIRAYFWPVTVFWGGDGTTFNRDRTVTLGEPGEGWNVVQTDNIYPTPGQWGLPVSHDVGVRTSLTGFTNPPMWDKTYQISHH